MNLTPKKQKILGVVSVVFSFGILFSSVVACSHSDEESYNKSSSSEIEETTTEIEETTTEIEETTTEIEETTSIVLSKEFNELFMPDTMRFGMSADETRDIERNKEKHNFNNEPFEYLSYYTTGHYTMDEYVYLYEANKLIGYWCSFDYDNVTDFFELYDVVKEQITQKYGECSSENIEWSDTTYKDSTSKWNAAFKYGYVSIYTKWEIGQNTIMLIQWEKDHLNVITTTPENENKLL